eukprot:c16024_g1_i1 orf=82-729(+)
MLDARDPESNVHVQLEAEMDKIIMLADNFNERALSATQNLAATRRRKGLRNLGRNSITSLVHKSRQNNSQSSCTAKLPLLLHKRPRLSPLAARAALAAAVTPLRQARQVILFESSQELSVHSGRCKAGTSCMVVAEDDPNNLHVVFKEKDQNTVATVKRGCGQFLEPIKEMGSLLVNQYDHENKDVELVIDIPIHEDLLPENAMDLIIDIPIFET